MVLIEVALGALLVLGVLAYWWHAKVAADNNRLRDLFGVAYQKFHAYDEMSAGEAKDTAAEAIMDVLSDPDCNKAEQWLREPAGARYLSSAFVNH